MAKDFDVYLKQRLTECDILIYSIPYHNGISVTDRLVLEAVVNGLTLQRYAAVQMGSELVSRIDKTIKNCLEKLNFGVGVGAALDVALESKLYLQDAPLVLGAEDVVLLKKTFTEASNAMAIAIAPLVTQVSSSTGRSYFDTFIGAAVSGSAKRSLLSLTAPVYPDAEIVQISQRDSVRCETGISPDASVRDLCWQLSFTAAAAVDIVAMVLGMDVRSSLGRWYDGIAVDASNNGTTLEVYTVAEAVVGIIQEAAGTLKKILYPGDSAATIMASNQGVSLKRYRLLSDMAEQTLAELGDMTLEELYMIEIA